MIPPAAEAALLEELDQLPDSAPPKLSAAQQNGQAVAKLNYSHDAMIDLLLARPMISQKEIAAAFGYTESWVSRLLQADAFKEMLAKRRGELIDPIVAQSFDTRLAALAHQSIEVLGEKLQSNPSGDLALKALEISARAMGYGVAKGAQVNIQQNYVVAMPQKSADSETWVAAHNPRVVNG